MQFLEFLSNLRTPSLDKFFLLVTELGGEMAFIAVAVIVFWCFSKRDGYLLLTIGFLGTVANQFLKISFRILRPWDLNPNFVAVPEAIPDASGFSFPSGHTQNSIGIFGTISLISKSSWVKAIALVICIIVPFSRMYLGVHTPLDVFFSVFFAILVIVVTKPLMYKAYKSKFGMFIFLGVMSIIALAFLIYMELIFDPSSLPSDQMHNYISALKNSYLIFGALVGVLIAFPIERKYVKFNESGKWYTQILKAGIGLILVLGLLEGLKIPLNAIFDANTIARALRYGLVVIFVIDVYPISFKWFKKLELKIEEKRANRKRIKTDR
ncbi:MAG: phosphatase PAP2 family protein [Clostridia bacterium]|nr:phosphatase PAP2 family protein [Clostridia bacterium]